MLARKKARSMELATVLLMFISHTAHAVYFYATPLTSTVRTAKGALPNTSTAVFTSTLVSVWENVWSTNTPLPDVGTEWPTTTPSSDMEPVRSTSISPSYKPTWDTSPSDAEPTQGTPPSYMDSIQRPNAQMVIRPTSAALTAADVVPMAFSSWGTSPLPVTKTRGPDAPVPQTTTLPVGVTHSAVTQMAGFPLTRFSSPNGRPPWATSSTWATPAPGTSSSPRATLAADMIPGVTRFPWATSTSWSTTSMPATNSTRSNTVTSWARTVNSSAMTTTNAPKNAPLLNADTLEWASNDHARLGKTDTSEWTTNAPSWNIDTPFRIKNTYPWNTDTLPPWNKRTYLWPDRGVFYTFQAGSPRDTTTHADDWLSCPLGKHLCVDCHACVQWLSSCPNICGTRGDYNNNNDNNAGGSNSSAASSVDPNIIVAIVFPAVVCLVVVGVVALNCRAKRRRNRQQQTSRNIAPNSRGDTAEFAEDLQSMELGRSRPSAPPIHSGIGVHSPSVLRESANRNVSQSRHGTNRNEYYNGEGTNRKEPNRGDGTSRTGQNATTNQSSLLDDGNSETQCTICNHSYDRAERTPKKTPCCTTTICLSCLLQVLDTSEGGKMMCPFCRTDLHVEDNADLARLPTDLQMLRELDKPVRFVRSTRGDRDGHLSVAYSREEEDLSTCTICFEEFNRSERCPKTLPCLHTFCLACLARVEGAPSAVVCPVCRTRTELEHQGEAVDLKDLPTNQLVLLALARK